LQWDRKLVRQGRKILLFLDNFSSHPPDLQRQLQAIELRFFPANTTPKTQPADQGIIHVVKYYYRFRICTLLIRLDVLREVDTAEATDEGPTTLSLTPMPGIASSATQPIRTRLLALSKQMTKLSPSER